MTLSESIPTDDDKRFFAVTFENARRLWKDSRLLCEHDRAKSSIILAVLAIEELGKALVFMWGVKNKANKREYPTHIEKQSAVFALLSCNEMLKKNKKRLRASIEKGENFHSMGPLSSQFAWARAGFYDDVRMAATYADKQPKIPQELSDSFGPDLAKELHEYFRKAALAVRNVYAMDLASTIYENDLGRL